MLKIVPMRDKALHDAADKLPPTRPVDEMVRGENARLFHFVSNGRRILTRAIQYLAYLETLAEIADWDTKGETHEECKVLAYNLIKMFKKRLQAIGSCNHCHPGSDEKAESGTGAVENVRRGEA